ncbi:MAG: CoA protein activase [Firmicutes bacterium]|nr:CoA protein activase [Bacillota bacterium]
MKITFPHMGTAYIPFRALIAGLGHEAITAPPCTQRTLNLGTRHAPESACLPLKINIGNYLEAAEQGAEAIIMAGGVGPCRFGFYAYVQQEILRDIGCGLEMIILEPPASGWRPLLARLKYLTQGVNAAQISRALRLTWAKLVACDRLEQLSLDIRAYELYKGSTTRALQEAHRQVDRADSVAGVRRAVQEGTAKLQSVPQDRQRPVLTMGVVGEIYTILEPFVNFRLEEQLGEMGVVVRRRLWLSDWILHHLILSSFRKQREAQLFRWAKPYLQHFVGGHGLESVAHSIQLAHGGVDGIVHILPFTCMPEIVAQSILPLVSRDYQLPILTMVVDEHTGIAGVRTRLEAFVDLLASRRAEANSHSRGRKSLAPAATYSS